MSVYSHPTGPVAPTVQPSVATLAAQATASFEATTITYAEWQRRVKLGLYTPKDGSQTNWGKGLAALAQLSKM